jgi:hypothetical protein
MNILQLSNLFNQIAQQVGFKQYHYGYVSDVYNGVSFRNNYNLTGTLPPLYPSILFEKPNFSLIISNVQKKVTARINLSFFAALNRDENNNIISKSAIEQELILRELAYKFLQGFYDLAQDKDILFSIVGNQFNFEQMPPMDKPNLIHLACSFDVIMLEDCEDFVFAFDKDTITSPQKFPPSDEKDYENPTLYTP